MRKIDGITLISLVITIVVLLILTGFSYSVLIGENGIISKANHAKLMTEVQACIEEIELAKLGMKIDKVKKISLENIESEINEYLGEDKAESFNIKNDEEKIFFLYKGYIFSIDKYSKVQYEGEDENLLKPFLGMSGYVEDGLILLFDGENNTGEDKHSNDSTIWKDLSKSKNDAELMGGASWEEDGLRLDGKTGKAKFKGDIPNNYTIFITLEADELVGTYPRLFGEDPFPSMHLRSVSSYALSFNGQNLDKVFPGYIYISPKKKVNICITYDGRYISLYYDGEKVSEIPTSTLPASTINAYLGAREANDRQLKGKIYNFMIYDRVLNYKEIQKNKNICMKEEQKSNISVYEEEGLTLLYDGIENTEKLHDDTVSIWKDLSGGDNNGVLSGGTSWGENHLNLDGNTGKVAYKGTITDEYTISMTLKADKVNTHPRLFAENSFPTVYLYSNASEKSYDFSLYAHGKDTKFITRTAIEENKLTNVCITYDGAKIVLYVDGVKKGELDSTIKAKSTVTAFIGGREANDRQLKGKIYNYLVYDRVLTEEQIYNNASVSLERFKD